MSPIIIFIIYCLCFINKSSAAIKDYIFATVGEKVITRSDIINEIRSTFKYKFNDIFTITLHIRRGDVSPSVMPDRYLYNKYHPKGLIIDCIEDMEKKV